MTPVRDFFRDLFRGVSEWLRLFVLTPRFLLVIQILTIVALSIGSALGVVRIVQELRR